MRRARKQQGLAAPGGDVLVLEGEDDSEDEGREDEGRTVEVAPASLAVLEPEPPSPATLVEVAQLQPKVLLGEMLKTRGLVTDAQVARALQLQADSGKRLGEVLVDIGALDERNLVDALADIFEIPVTDLRHEAPDPAALALVTEQVARENLAIPVLVDDEGLHVVVAQPSDDLRFLLAATSGYSVRLRLAPVTDIRWAIDRNYQAIGGVGKLVQAFEAVEVSRKRPANASALTAVAENAPVVQVVDSILTQAVRDRVPTSTSNRRTAPFTSGSASTGR